MLRRSPRSRSPSPLQAPPPESLLSEIHAAMMSLLCDCNQHMSVEDPESIVVETRSGDTAEVVHWSARGFREVDVGEVHEAFLHYEIRKFYHASSIASATSIFADGFLKKRGGHERGFTEAVMGQVTLKHAWFNHENMGIVFEGNLYGEVTRHGTAGGIANHEGWEPGWRDRFCNRLGHHIHKRKKGDSQYYMNEKTIELTGFYVENTTKMVAKLRSVLMRRRNPRCRRR